MSQPDKVCSHCNGTGWREETTTGTIHGKRWSATDIKRCECQNIPPATA